MDSTQSDMLFVIVIITVCVIIVAGLFKTINEKVLNNRAPVLEIPVKVVEKRVQRRNRNKNHSRNVFKVIFEDLDTAERHTFSVTESEFDQMVENDIGYLSYQRKRFHAFQRDELAAEFEDEVSSKDGSQFKIEE
ncbi:DUF2500 domain-containing protein [uncultured Kordia sp.]|uniref:DUF2500 domain-containing protein n=1 Tax=uncultured Kordia sp. TaxID=507699 RepID=UPI002605D5F0|nr:DUF2500 domain-containing protein [uncultured Kordia sp.]